jgi:hypothetical protein
MTAEPRRFLVVATRTIVALAIVVAVIAYTTGVVRGTIPRTGRIDAVHLTIIVLALLVVMLSLNPTLIERIRTVEMKGFKIELLERIQERQLRQEDQLQDVKLLIPLLFPEAERKHLSNISRGTTKGYRGGGALRDELRRLRSIGLIRMRNNHAVGELRSDMTVDLSEYVELTDLGQRWVQRLADLEFATVDSEQSKEERSSPGK